MLRLRWPPLDRVRAWDARAYQAAARLAQRASSTPEPLLVRWACLIVASFFSYPTATALIHHHARTALGYLDGLAGLAFLALLSWMRERADRLAKGKQHDH